MRSNLLCFFMFMFLLQFKIATASDLKVICQVIGFAETNCYLIYDSNSKEAAVIDPGWQAD